MKAFNRSVFVVAALALTLAACSQPNDLQGPRLEAQFGTTDDDIGVDVATDTAGRTFVLSSGAGPIYEGDQVTGEYQKALLQRYDSSGQVLWSHDVDAVQTDYDADYGYIQSLTPNTLETDGRGNAYALITFHGKDHFHFYDVAYTGYTVAKYTAAGTKVTTVEIGNLIVGAGNNSTPVASATFAVDGSGYIYAGSIKCTEMWDDYDPPRDVVGGDCAYYVSKFSSANTGAIQVWQRPSTVGIPHGITVTGTGHVYVIGSSGMARYSNSGNLLWTKTGTSYRVGVNSKIVASGSSLYVRNLDTIRKYDANGKLLWSKLQGGLKTLVIQDVSADTSGNLYLSGKYEAGASNWNPFVRKLNAYGTSLWTRTYGTPAYDDARGVSTVSGSAIYLTGETQGSLAHPNLGGPQNRDGYLRKLNSSGNPLWTR